PFVGDRKITNPDHDTIVWALNGINFVTMWVGCLCILLPVTNDLPAFDLGIHERILFVSYPGTAMGNNMFYFFPSTPSFEHFQAFHHIYHPSHTCFNGRVVEA